MREIKFRAWDKKNKRMVRIKSIVLNEEIKILGFIENQSLTEFGWVDNSYLIFMQYTGLKDKNGKEIFEGDILLVPDFYTDVIVDGQGITEEYNHLAIIVFNNGSFGCEIQESGSNYRKGFYLLNEIGALFEVIGNIYENPELLERSDSNGNAQMHDMR